MAKTHKADFGVSVFGTATVQSSKEHGLTSGHYERARKSSDSRLARGVPAPGCGAQMATHITSYGTAVYLRVVLDIPRRRGLHRIRVAPTGL